MSKQPKPKKRAQPVQENLTEMPALTFKKMVGYQARALREEAGLEQQVVADLMTALGHRMSRGVYSQVEMGVRHLTHEQLFVLAVVVFGQPVTRMLLPPPGAALQFTSPGEYPEGMRREEVAEALVGRQGKIGVGGAGDWELAAKLGTQLGDPERPGARRIWRRRRLPGSELRGALAQLEPLMAHVGPGEMPEGGAEYEVEDGGLLIVKFNDGALSYCLNPAKEGGAFRIKDEGGKATWSYFKNGKQVAEEQPASDALREAVAAL